MNNSTIFWANAQIFGGLALMVFGFTGIAKDEHRKGAVMSACSGVALFSLGTSSLVTANAISKIEKNNKQ